VSTFGALAGEYVQASDAALPAATTYVTPELIEFCIAVFNASEYEPLMLMFATAGSRRFAVTQSTPAMTPLVVPLPLQSRTRTAYSAT
jgi:hypothetical protein